MRMVSGAQAKKFRNWNEKHGTDRQREAHRSSRRIYELFIWWYIIVACPLTEPDKE